MTKADMRHLREIGCEALVVASYGWKIPDWRESLKYAINFHPSPLPEGRGNYPPVRAILEGRTCWGVTCHRLSQEFDEGDILAAELFPLEPDECHEGLDLKIQMAARKLAARIARQFVQLWDEAKPQTGGSYWPKITPRDRVIDFQQPVGAILRHIRAFGTTQSLSFLADHWMAVPRAAGWTEAHNYAPGTVVHAYTHNRSIVVAAPDGYIALLDTYVPSAQQTAGL
jgi:methionyl-tRNA formyltransferase